MAERKFTRALNKPGMAAQLRETVSQVVRESAVLARIHEGKKENLRPLKPKT
ncbi:hypothetical protein FF38_05145 [Lucilia cuprina]|uniref:Uncharacterized protein n=1 Tax=Lucilia cuprina TaxID=7375 RepID=A0A0L0CEI2_LUCCU|nr:hypothetical protein FF38_05145 [Lucilia cuprina]